MKTAAASLPPARGPHELTIDGKTEDPQARCFLAVGPSCWGKGITRTRAVANARMYKPSYHKGPVKWVVFYCHPSCYIDDMGAICWDKKYGEPERIEG